MKSVSCGGRTPAGGVAGAGEAFELGGTLTGAAALGTALAVPNCAAGLNEGATLGGGACPGARENCVALATPSPEGGGGAKRELGFSCAEGAGGCTPPGVPPFAGDAL